MYSNRRLFETFTYIDAILLVKLPKQAELDLPYDTLGKCHVVWWPTLGSLVPQSEEFYFKRHFLPRKPWFSPKIEAK